MKLIAKRCMYDCNGEHTYCPFLSAKISIETVGSMQGNIIQRIPYTRYFCGKYSTEIYYPFDNDCLEYMELQESLYNNLENLN